MFWGSDDKRRDAKGAVDNATEPTVIKGDTKAAAPSSPSPAPTLQPSIRSRDEELSERFGKARSALGPGTVISGRLSFDTPVRIDGKLSGDVTSSKAVIIGPSAVVEATLDVEVLIVLGKVKGPVTARERVELLNGGSIVGDVSTPIFVIEEGGSFSGGCKMTSARAEKISPAKKGDGSRAGNSGPSAEPAAAAALH